MSPQLNQKGRKKKFRKLMINGRRYRFTIISVWRFQDWNCACVCKYIHKIRCVFSQNGKKNNFYYWRLAKKKHVLEKNHIYRWFLRTFLAKKSHIFDDFIAFMTQIDKNFKVIMWLSNNLKHFNKQLMKALDFVST